MFKKAIQNCSKESNVITVVYANYTVANNQSDCLTWLICFSINHWGPMICVPICMTMHPIVVIVEIFHSWPKWWTDWPTHRHCHSTAKKKNNQLVNIINDSHNSLTDKSNKDKKEIKGQRPYWPQYLIDTWSFAQMKEARTSQITTLNVKSRNANEA